MKYKNNKEHPIDNLFAQKLSHLEGDPSGNAWQALEKGLSQKARKKNKAIFWLPYASAAAIVLLVVSVWLFRQQTIGSLHNTGLATKEQVDTKNGKNTSTSTPTTKPPTQDSLTLLPENTSVEGQIALQEEIAKKETVGKPKESQETVIAKQLKPEAKEKKSVIQPMVEQSKQEIITKPAIAPLENTVAQMEKQPTVVMPASLTKEESTTLVVTVNLEEETEEFNNEYDGEEETEQFQRKSKAGKIFSTLKKIKKGDFDELGIRPETIVAYVKDRASANNQSNEK